VQADQAMTGQTAPVRRYGSPRPFRAKPRPADYVTGRPTLYEPEYCQTVVEFMGEGYSLTAFAGEIRVSKDAVYEWIDRWPEFRHAVKIARAARLRALERKLLTTKIGVGVTAAIFALKNADPDEWKDLYQNETNINVNIQQLSDDQLMAIAAAGKPALTIEHDPTPEAQHTDER